MDKLLELHKEKRMVLPEMRRLQMKGHRLNEEETIRLITLKEAFDYLNKQIHEAEILYVKENHGEQKLQMFIERIKLKSSPFTYDSEVGRRIKILDGELKSITDYFSKNT